MDQASEEAIQLAYGTSVVLLRCPLVPELMQLVSPEVFPSIFCVVATSQPIKIKQRKKLTRLHC